MEDYLVAKIVSIFVLGGVAIFLGLLPIKLVDYFNKRYKDNLEKNAKKKTSITQIVLTALNCFGAGVILTTCFTHMLPEVDHLLIDLEEEGLIKDGG